jgi:hypothetical protein
MKLRCLICAIALFGLGAMPAAAQVPPGRTCLMTTVGADAITLRTPAQAHPEGFAVRLTDLQGNPLRGVEVWFFVNTLLTIGPPQPGAPPLPAPETYGQFAEGQLISHTDELGIARSAAFTGGTVSGSYETAAYVWVSGGPTGSHPCGSAPGPVAYFQVRQLLGPRVASGVPESIPVMSNIAGLLLGLSLLAIGVLGARRLQ